MTSATPNIHVLTLTPFYPSLEDDASGCFIAEPLSWLSKNGISNTVMGVQPVYRRRRMPHPGLPAAGCFSYFSLPGGFGLPSAGAFLYARLLSVVRQEHCVHPFDLIHAHAPLPCGHAAALLSRELGVPFVISVHGLDAYSSVQVRGPAGRWCRRISSMVYRSARRVICISEHVRAEVFNGTGNCSNTSVVYNGVDTAVFLPDDEDEACNPVILSIGNLIPIKGHDLLLRAVARLKTKHPGLSCDIVGDGPERARLLALASQLKVSDSVRLLGRQSRASVARLLQRCTIFALPSRYEGLGCVYLEAMSAGKPVIGCRGQGIAEIIQHGVNGCLVESDDLQGLSTAISDLLENETLRKRIGDAARRTVLQGLTLAHQAERLTRVYEECLG
jgi:glycosyltransferase involved in cell wall biosynthesis